MKWRLPLITAGLLLAAAGCDTGDDEIVIGSKNFTESVVLGDVLQLLVQKRGLLARHQRGLGGTRLVYNALASGEIDAYVEYTGTLTSEIFATQAPASKAELDSLLADAGIRIAGAIGFQNNYALGMLEARAAALGIDGISDLLPHPELVLRFGNEFMERADGWPGLREHYRLPHADVRGIDHDVAYRALEAGDADITDLYTTDAEIAYYGLRTLVDDRDYFPRYAAVVLYRAELEQRSPEAVRALKAAVGLIDETRMIAMNSAVKLGGKPELEVAADFLRSAVGVDTAAITDTRWTRLVRYTTEHLVLVALSLSAAILIAVPLGVLAARRPRLGQFVLGVVGIAQTIPALALLVVMVPLFGIGAGPALVALFLYSLLPIVRNTHAGLMDIPVSLLESARALGLPDQARLRLVEFPLALPTILAGVKTAAVINVGAATLGALVGAGGYGQPILTGIRLDDTALILEGAIPAALMALAAQWLFEFAEKSVVPRGLRQPGAG